MTATAKINKKPFTAAMFTPTSHASAGDKAKFANHFIRFVLGGFSENLFQKWFYTRLSMTFGHIAHYDQGGFYATWFADPRKQVDFIEHTIHCRCPGSPEYTFCDVERAIIDWLLENRRHVDDVLRKTHQAQQQTEQAELNRHNAIADQTHQQFKVVAKSKNTGSFGHKQYVVVAQDGSAYKIHIVPSNLELQEQQILNVPLKNGAPVWNQFFVEVPERLSNVPDEVLKEAWA